MVRSTRRRRSATAFVRDGRIVVQIPAGLPDDRELEVIAGLVDRVSGRDRVAAVAGDETLGARAADLADRYLDGIRPTSIRWSSRMRRRWGSCTQADGTIRINRSLQAFPTYVLDYVIIHELAHLTTAGHGPAFHALVSRYPHVDRAQGFLEGLQFEQARYDPDYDPWSSPVSGPDDPFDSSSPSWPDPVD